MTDIVHTLKWLDHAIGFDHLLNDFSRIQVNATNYPPYNIAKYGETTILEFALAGYSKDAIDISVDKNNLIIRGEKIDDRYEYQHKGISTKRFERSFVLAEHAVVQKAEFIDGLLRVFIDIVIPEDKKPRQIPIT